MQALLQGPGAPRAQGVEARVHVGVHRQVHQRPVVEPGPLEVAVLEAEAQGLHQVQLLQEQPLVHLLQGLHLVHLLLDIEITYKLTPWVPPLVHAPLILLLMRKWTWNVILLRTGALLRKRRM